MSRYVRVDLGLAVAREELLAALAALELGVEIEQAAFVDDRVMLEGSLECAGEPVDLRLPAGTLGSVEDLGFVREADRWRLVCGELDTRTLEAELLAPLRQTLALARVRGAAAAAGLSLEEQLEADGSRRLRLREGRD
ncbi:hypothetical protein G6O69_02755 [Pseudenhygromyxa sp. WMMC2535]|uniref:hypothetical protein n=1 Tax=Pseudenhygromyxa sp. WMMC2535 TaxID=2712867 RepID=UPI001553666E|nr:hypothetical protein [Pseudenhygromyxa sp. WMMC2535]NVB36736.1 hypothetical protein [Pseudenhygromyxa sp. WMMC2535]